MHNIRSSIKEKKKKYNYIRLNTGLFPMSWRLATENVIMSLGISPANKYPKYQAAKDAKKSPANFTGPAKVKNKQQQTNKQTKNKNKNTET